MEEKVSKPPEKIAFYTISIKGGDKERTIRLSSGLFRFGVASVIICACLLVATGAYSFYSTMKMQRDALTIQEIEQAAELRQEQLLTLSKKAATLSETIQNLAQQEQELRIQAGLNPPKEDASPETAEAPQETPAAPLTPEEKIRAVINSAKAKEPQPVAEVQPADKIRAIINSAKAKEPTQPAPVEVQPAPIANPLDAQSEERIRAIINSAKANEPPVANVAPPVEVQPAPPANPLDAQSAEEIREIINSFKETPQIVEAAVEVIDNPKSNELDIAQVSATLDMLETKVSTRKESLDAFQTELKQQREQLAVGAAIASGYSPNFEGFSSSFSSSSTVQFDFANGLPIIPSAGAIPAPGSFPFDPSLVGGSGAADSHIPSIWPTTGVVSSPYGLRWGGTDFHPGMDIANDMGTPIVATADGVVEYAGWNSGGYGNMVDINHGNGIMTRYGHAMQVVVSTGQQVKRGQLIAYMGSTGFSTGPHVHYEVHINGNRVNPISYL